MRSMMTYFRARHHTSIYISSSKYLYIVFTHMTLLTFKSINIKYYKYLYLCTEVFIPMWSTIFVRERLTQGRLGKCDAEMRGPRLGINTCMVLDSQNSS